MAATDREQQILAWIKQNPLISQNELAELCGITRSGVAAHISNLMKKGYIQGKGYIVTPPSYVAVVGAINTVSPCRMWLGKVPTWGALCHPWAALVTISPTI